MISPTQEQLAYVLWAGGFGDDAERNWYMADWLLQSEVWEQLVKDAGELKEGPALEQDKATALRDRWVRRLAETLYDLSYRLTVPSDNQDVNWRAAEALWAALG